MALRLFVAVTFPEELRLRLWRQTAELRAGESPVRWVGPERLHLTLKFIGAVEEGRVGALSRAVDAAAREGTPFRLELRGTGAFPSLDRPRVWWVGAQPAPELVALQARVEDALAELGVEREDRPFHPHVTLGRSRRGAGREALGAVAAAARGASPEAEHLVEEIELVRSRLGSGGPRYTVESAHRLAGARGEAGEEAGGAA